MLGIHGKSAMEQDRKMVMTGQTGAGTTGKD